MSLSKYDPTLAGLLVNAEADWGRPDEHVGSLVFYGIPPIDKALYGLNVKDGELLSVQGEPKARKTTLTRGIFYNVATQRKAGWVCLDSLESGEPPLACRDSFLAMVTTRVLISRIYGDDRTKWPAYAQIIEHEYLREQIGQQGITREFIWYNKRTPEQATAIATAAEMLAQTPIMIFGPHEEEGNARNVEATMQRWDQLYQGTYPSVLGKFVRFFVVDHIQQYDCAPGDDYRTLEIATGHIARFVTRHPGAVVFVVSQISETSKRLADQGFGKRQAKGGGKLLAESNVMFETYYDESDKAAHMIRIGSRGTRRRPFPKTIQEIDPASGAFLRPAYPDKVG